MKNNSQLKTHYENWGYFMVDPDSDITKEQNRNLCSSELDLHIENNEKLSPHPLYQKKHPKETVEKNIETTVKQEPKKSLFWLINFNIRNGIRQLNNSFYPYATLMGVSGIILGLITAFRNLFANLFQGFFGRLSDKYGRKFFLILGFSILSISTIILIFFANSVVLVILSIFQALAISMIIPVWNATLGDVAPKEKRATFFGKIIAISAAIDLVFSFFLTMVLFLADLNVKLFGYTFSISEKNQYHLSFIIAIANTLAAILFLIFLKKSNIRENKENDVDIENSNIKITTSHFLEIFQDKSFVKFLVINSFFGLVMAFSWPADPVALITILKMDYWQIILYMNLLSAIMSLVFYFGGKLSDRIGRRKPFLITGRLVIAFYCLLLFLTILLDCWWMIFFDLIISSIGWGLINSSIIAYTIDLAPEKNKGLYLGLFNACWGIFCFFGSLLGGLIIDLLLKQYNHYLMGLIIYGLGFFLRLIFGFLFFFIDDVLT